MNRLHRVLNIVLSIHIAAVCLSGPFLLIGFSELAKTWRLLQTHNRIEGVVTGNSYYEDSSEDGSGAYYPTVRFLPEDSPPIHFTDGIGSSPPSYHTGDRVMVLYDPLHPQDARINTWLRVWFAPLLIVGIGLLPLIVGLMIAWPENSKPADS